ncbi:MAG: M28 family peptidase [Candidatus Lokiarchaeota archaeon]|nr:M28 family peptidase [Candidatus Lokiarchaeota archaeon]
MPINYTKFIFHRLNNSVMKLIDDIQGSRLYNYMMDFIKIGWRRVGTENSTKASNYILNKFKEFKLENVHLEPFEMLLYLAKKWELSFKSPNLPNQRIKIDCHPLWHTKSSDPEGIEAEMVHVGFGTSKEFRNVDVRNKIVVVNSYRMMNFYPTMDFWRVYERSRKRGSIGLIAIHDSPPGTLFVEYATRHQTMKETNLESGSIPALIINYESGKYLKSLLETDEKITCNMLLKSNTKRVDTENVFGMLPGKKSDEIILIGTHTDSWFDGAIDNAGGNAGFLELADYYSQIPKDKREKTMIFAGFAGHEVGSIGAIEFAKKHKDMLSKVATFCMIDGFGSKGYLLESPTRGIVETGMDEPKGLFTTDNQVLFDFIKDSTLKYGLFPSMHVSAVAGAFSDLGPFVHAAIPSIMIIGKGIFYHTIEDTADKVLPRQLERTAKAHIEIINKIHETPTKVIYEADRKGIEIPKQNKKSNKNKKGSVYFNFNITPNPMIRGTTALIYLTSYLCNNRIIIDLKWNIKGKEIHSPIFPQRFGKVGRYKVQLILLDNYGYEYTSSKYAYVIERPQ